MQTTQLHQVRIVQVALWRILGLALTIVFWTVGCWGQVGTTTVQDTVYNADGTYASGTILVSWPAFETATGNTVAAGNISAQITGTGQVSLNLAPNVGATPTGSYYTAVYHLADGTVSKEYWVIPNVPSTSIAAIRSLIMPASIAVQTITATQVNTLLTKYLPLSGGSLNGALQLPSDPATAMQAATKNYVDNAVAPISSEVAQAVSSAPQGNQVVKQPVGTSLSSNVLQGKYYASQFQVGGNNNGIANLATSTSCAAGSPKGLNGCTIVVDPTYPNTENPQGYGAYLFGNNTKNTPWPLATHVHDERNGVTADYYENPFSNVPYQAAGQMINTDYTLDYQQWPLYNGNLAGTEYLQTTAFQGGYNFFNYYSGSPQYFFKTYYQNLGLASTDYGSGQMESIINNVNCHGTGDCIAQTTTVTCDGGMNSVDDEGCHGGDFTVSEDPVVYTGTLTAAVAVGATQLGVSATNGAGTQGEDRLIVDTTTGVITGNSFTGAVGTSKTGPATSALNPNLAIDSAAAYPVSTMVQLCYAGTDNGQSGGGCAAGSQPIGYIPSAPNMINPVASITTNVVASYSASGYSGLPAGFCTPSTLQSSNSAAACYLPASGTACISDQQEYESVNYTYNSTAQQITLLNLRFPHENGLFFAHGGLCGYAVESQADVFTGDGNNNNISQVFPVLGSPNATSFYYISQRTNLGYTGPVLGESNAINSYTSPGGGECFTLNASIFQLQADNHTVYVASNVPFNSGANLSPINGMTLVITTPNSTYNGSYVTSYGNTGNDTGNWFSYYLPTPPTGTAPTSGTASFCNTNYKLYPSVRVNSVLNATNQQVDGTMNTMPAPVAMNSGDTVKQPHYPWIVTAHDSGRGVLQFLPREYLGGALYGMNYGYLLSGIGTTGFSIENSTDQNKYLGYGGTHIAPSTGYILTGEWSDDFYFGQPGEDAVIKVGSCKPSPVGCNNAVSNFNVLSVPSSWLNYDPRTGLWTFAGGFNNVSDAPSGSYYGAATSLVNVGQVNNPVAMYGIPFMYGGQVSWTWTPAHPEPNVAPLAEAYTFSSGGNSAATVLSEPGGVSNTIDCGSGYSTSNCTFNAGTINATSASASTVAASTSVKTAQLTVGSSSPVNAVTFYSTGAITPASVPGASCSDQTFSVAGLQTIDNLGSISPPAALGNISINGYVSAANTLTLHLCNVSQTSATPPAGAYAFLAMH